MSVRRRRGESRRRRASRQGGGRADGHSVLDAWEANGQVRCSELCCQNPPTY